MRHPSPPPRRSLGRWRALPPLLLFFTACGARSELDVEPPPWPCASAATDLLFVIDASPSMVEEQEALAAQVPLLVRSLIDPPDLDGDGASDWVPVADLQVGVITSDLGRGLASVSSCDERGDAGRLRTRGADRPECLEEYPAILDASTGLEDLAAATACLAQVGTDGCRAEQPLEATLRALARAGAYDEPGTTVHADRVNAGFLRPGALLAIVILTDEDDCSLADPTLFDSPS